MNSLEIITCREGLILWLSIRFTTENPEKIFKNLCELRVLRGE
jgi:hypothetical protein